MSDLHGRRVLLVEDETLVALMVEDMLAELGCIVVASAGTLSEARRYAAEGDFDLALLDVNLKGEKVFPVADDLRRRGIPVVFATGYGAHGVGDYQHAPTVAKPYRLTDLEQALHAAIGNVPP
jgi:CheY-like chemotaxis protein